MNISRCRVIRGNIVLAGIVLCVEMAGPVSPVVSQVIPDATLGAERSQVTPNANASNTDLVEGGALRGRNLFHSFQEFNVNLGQRVYFANPAGVQSIFGRVTGGTVSNILGTLGVNGSANLFLLNPQGFLFGPNATLDIRGSFLATTGDRFLFPDNQTFGVDTPTAPLLTVSAPSGVQYGGTPSTIRSQGNLAVGQDLTLASGNLAVQGSVRAGGNLTLQAQDTVTIRDSATVPFIARSGRDLTIQGNQRVDILALNHLSQTPFVSGGNMTLISDAPVSADAHFTSGGNFSVRTLTGTISNLVSEFDPIFNVAGNFDIGNYTGASLQVTAGGNITYGTVVINAIDPVINPTQPAFLLNAQGDITGTGTVSTTVPNGDLLVNFNSGRTVTIADILSQGGDINLQAGTTINLQNARLDTSINTGTGNSGNIKIIAGQAVTGNGGFIVSLTGPNSDPTSNPNGIAGDILIQAGASRGPAIALVNTTIDAASFGAQGTTGSITLRASNRGDILLQGQGTKIFTDTFGASSVDKSLTISGGNIRIDNYELNATLQSPNDVDGASIRIEGDSISLTNNAKIITEVRGRGGGTAGDIFITGNNLSLTGNSQISGRVRAEAFGNAGNIAINMTGATEIEGPESFISGSVGLNAEGDGGQISVKTGSLRVAKGARIAASTEGLGNAGEISIQASGDVVLSQNARFSSAIRFGGEGFSGSISLTANTLALDQDSLIETLVAAGGNTPFGEQGERAGSITISVANQVNLDRAKITASNLSGDPDGGAGNISVTSRSLKLDQDAAIEARSVTGKGGDVRIAIQDFLVLRRDSEISTTAGSEEGPGQGGNIFISAPQGFVIAVPLEDSDIIANAFGGQGGRIDLKANRVFGLKERSRLTPTQLQEIRTNGSSDISASSDVGAEGSIAIETLQIDPSQGLTEVPVDLVDPTGLISQGCQPSTGAKANRGEYVVTGRGGLPPSVNAPQTSRDNIAPWVTQPLPRSSAQPAPIAAVPLPAPVQPLSGQPLIEAQGIAIAANGTTFLIAQSPTVTPRPASFPQGVCPAAQTAAPR